MSLRRPSRLAINPHKPISAALQRYATTVPTGPGTPFDHIDKKHEQEVAKSPLEPHPDEVSVDSSVRHVFREEGVENKEDDIDMLAGVKSDLVGSMQWY